MPGQLALPGWQGLRCCACGCSWAESDAPGWCGLLPAAPAHVAALAPPFSTMSQRAWLHLCPTQDLRRPCPAHQQPRWRRARHTTTCTCRCWARGGLPFFPCIQSVSLMISDPTWPRSDCSGGEGGGGGAGEGGGAASSDASSRRSTLSETLFNFLNIFVGTGEPGRLRRRFCSALGVCQRRCPLHPNRRPAVHALRAGQGASPHYHALSLLQTPLLPPPSRCCPWPCHPVHAGRLGGAAGAITAHAPLRAQWAGESCGCQLGSRHLQHCMAIAALLGHTLKPPPLLQNAADCVGVRSDAARRCQDVSRAGPGRGGAARRARRAAVQLPGALWGVNHSGAGLLAHAGPAAAPRCATLPAAAFYYAPVPARLPLRPPGHARTPHAGLGPLSALQLVALVSTLCQAPLLFVDLKRLSKLVRRRGTVGRRDGC